MLIIELLAEVFAASKWGFVYGLKSVVFKIAVFLACSHLCFFSFIATGTFFIPKNMTLVCYISVTHLVSYIRPHSEWLMFASNFGLYFSSPVSPLSPPSILFFLSSSVSPELLGVLSSIAAFMALMALFFLYLSNKLSVESPDDLSHLGGYKNNQPGTRNTDRSAAALR